MNCPCCGFFTKFCEQKLSKPGEKNVVQAKILNKSSILCSKLATQLGENTLQLARMSEFECVRKRERERERREIYV